jgi:hypothetical protein
MPEARGLYEVSRERMRTRHFAYRTEQAYLSWIRRYVNFHNRKHPREMGSSYVEAFLTHLAVDGHVLSSVSLCCWVLLIFRSLPVILRYFEIRPLPLYCRHLGFFH